MFELGDRVQSFADYRKGVVHEILKSITTGGRFYIVLWDGDTVPDEALFTEKDIHKLIDEEIDFSCEVTMNDGVVAATILENGRGVARGHGHIIHNDPLYGYVQALSYALKKIFHKMQEEKEGKS